MGRPTAAPDRGLGGVGVVICRAEADAGGLIAKLIALDAVPIAVPLHAVAAPTDGGQALRSAVAELSRFRWLVATSANGVRAFLDTLGPGGGPVSDHVGGRHEHGKRAETLPAPIRVAAVGPATAAVFEEAGIAVELVPSRATAADLVAAFPVGAGTTPVLAPLAEAASDELETGLRAKGYAVHRVDAYRMVEVPEVDGQTEALAKAAAVLFSAPSLVDRFITRFGLQAVPATVVCIGPRTAAQARLRGVSDVVEVTEPGEDGLIDALVATLPMSGQPRK